MEVEKSLFKAISSFGVFWLKIKNVIKVVEKYDGFYLFEPEGDEFSAIVIIPMDF